jgi:predicted esterase
MAVNSYYLLNNLAFMIRIFTFLLTLATLSFPFAALQAQTTVSDRCATTGFSTLLDIPVEFSTVKYAENNNLIGQNVDLFMDVFEPVGDNSELRPAIILAFGGSFLAGNRADMHDLCRFYAQHGYVAISMDYRLFNFLWGFTFARFTEVILGAMSDMRAVVRYLRIDADTDNLYRIDTNNIFVGGYSAGAFTALNVGYFEESDLGDNLPDYVLEAYEKIGTPEGNTGAPETFAYSSAVAGVLNLSGALIDSALIDKGEPLLLSIHGTADATVPYGFGNALSLFAVYGSSTLHTRALNEEVPSYLYTIEGGGHTDIYTSNDFEADRLAFYAVAMTRLEEKICENFSTSQRQRPSLTEVKIFPNPAQESLSIHSSESIQSAEIISTSGNLVLHHTLNAKGARLPLDSLAPGLYILRILHSNGEIISKKIIKN